MRIRKNLSTMGWRHGSEWRHESAQHKNKNPQHKKLIPSPLATSLPVLSFATRVIDTARIPVYCSAWLSTPSL